MSSAQGSLFGGARLQMTQSIQLTIDSLNTYGPSHDHWAIAWSGGKDSSTLVSLVVYLIESGKVARPKSLTVLYADTRMELLPLSFAAQEIRDELAEREIECRTVMAPLDKRFFVYVFGRGVPPPNNNTLRWCTRQIKIDPMAASLVETAVARGLGAMVEHRGRLVYRSNPGQKLLVLTGVRQGESAIRDGRIAMSCSKDGAECGQGWYQETLPGQLCDTLAPLLHWRVCHVWEWLKHWAPSAEFGDWSTRVIADAYGGEEAEEVNARTGCVGCPLANQDTALESVIATPRWAYLAPLRELRPLYRELREPPVRLRKRGLELRKDGTAAANPQRMGPITLEAREMALGRVLDIQRRCNEVAIVGGRPLVDLINAEEEARIRELIAAQTWPDKWDGSEPTGDVMLESIFADGTAQPLLTGMFEGEGL